MGGVRFGDVGRDYTKRPANLKSGIIFQGMIHNKILCERLGGQSIPLGDSIHTTVVTAIGQRSDHPPCHQV